MFGDPTGPVGIACHTLMINIVASTAINIVSPVTNHLGLFKATGMSIVEGAELHKTVHKKYYWKGSKNWFHGFKWR